MNYKTIIQTKKGNKKNMKNLIILLLVLISGLLFASSMEVSKTDGTTVSIELDEITNITFIAGGTPPPENMVLIPAGSFDMGDHFGEGGNSELPVHNVSLSAYYMNKYEVTQLEYETLIGSNPSNTSYGIGAAYPVNQVSYYDIMVYCNKLSIEKSLTPCYTIDGSTNPADWGTIPTSSDDTWNAVICDFSVTGYRLPTEAEWEYAAKGGASWEDHNRYSGCIEETDLPDYAWYSSNSGSTSHEVGTKLPNQLGLYDMSGNLYEWCFDWYGSDYYGISPASNPSGPASGSYHILRGSNWAFSASSLRNTYRFYNYPDYLSTYVGFRLVRTAQ